MQGCGMKGKHFFYKKNNNNKKNQHLVLAGPFVSRDLPLQVLDVALQGTDQSQQPLSLLLQFVDVCRPVIDLSLQTVELPSRSRPPRKKRGSECIRVGQEGRSHLKCSAHLLCHDTSFPFQIRVALFLSVKLPLILDLDIMDLPLLILLCLLYEFFKLADLLLCILLTLHRIESRK